MEMDELEPWDESPNIINLVTENTKGSKNSYKWDPKGKVFKLDKVLYSSTTYPTDYGFLPRSQNDDGEPLRSFVLTDQPTFTGCVVRARPLGVLKMLVNGQYNDKLISVQAEDEAYHQASELDDLPEKIKKEIAHFFIQTQEIACNDVKIVAWKGPAVAKNSIEHAVKLYGRKRSV